MTIIHTKDSGEIVPPKIAMAKRNGVNHQSECLKPSFVKPIKTTNIISERETFDTLHHRAIESTHCTAGVCTGSKMYNNIVGVEVRNPEVILEQAKEFIDQYYASNEKLASSDHEKRWQQIQNEVAASNSYQLTEEELLFGAKAAWRNSARCIGRIQWSKLQLFDCRGVTSTKGMFDALCNHIQYATNKGNIKSAITVFPQRYDGTSDYRVWNSQLVSYAGYKKPDGTFIGDPLNTEFTEFCTKLGWKSERTDWDILPIVLSAHGQDPDFFDYPPGLILQVPFSHPKFKWFAGMNLRWYALPAVSGMLFDCGGIQFPGTAFSGWYMSTEIGCRNLCDKNRRNLLEPIAMKMGLDTRNLTSLWKDKALVEINIAVMHSFQSQNITIVDHHTASESFMKHQENEAKLRKGCPADWVWIVPPMSSSILPVFHQEMASYYLRPSFDYQQPASKTHVWKSGENASRNKNKFHFKQIARVVLFTSKLYGKALSRRIKATVLYATETGTSELYANQLVELLKHAFNAKIYLMADYDIKSLKDESLLLIVASTFGNGDPPENGEHFAKELFAMNSQKTGQKLLKNLKFGVFALGSSAYPHFCEFGKNLDKVLSELGGQRIMELATGDHLSGQEQEFNKWTPEVFKASCKTFGLDKNQMTSLTIKVDTPLTKDSVRFLANKISNESLDNLLIKYHNKKVKVCQVKRQPKVLNGDSSITARPTVLVEILTYGVDYEPGDHVGIFPKNQTKIVDGIISRLDGAENPDEIVQLQVLKEKQSSSGNFSSWENHERLPVCSLRILLTRFLDVTTVPSKHLLTFLANWCDKEVDKNRLNKLINDAKAYEDWKQRNLSHLLEVLEEFPSCKPPASLLVAHLMPLQPRFYSISSSPRMYPDEIHLTVGVLRYTNDEGNIAERHGVCSNYLESLEADEEVLLFVRSATGFHLPKDSSSPIILIGPGTGIAPFRGFWQEWEEMKRRNAKIPEVWLFFGCQTKASDLYRDEKEILLDKNILARNFLALSREPNTKKTYVQDLALNETDELYRLVVKEKGHVYVCGDVKMAEHVYQTLREIFALKEKMTDPAIDKFMQQLRDDNRYHEDIFGIRLRTVDTQNKSKNLPEIKIADTQINVRETENDKIADTNKNTIKSVEIKISSLKAPEIKRNFRKSAIYDDFEDPNASKSEVDSVPNIWLQQSNFSAKKWERIMSNFEVSQN